MIMISVYPDDTLGIALDRIFTAAGLIFITLLLISFVFIIAGQTPPRWFVLALIGSDITTIVAWIISAWRAATGRDAKADYTNMMNKHWSDR